MYNLFKINKYLDIYIGKLLRDIFSINNKIIINKKETNNDLICNETRINIKNDIHSNTL